MTMNIPTGGGGGGMDPAKEQLLFSKLEDITKKINGLMGGSGGGGGSSSSMSPVARAGSSGAPDIFAEDRNKDNQFHREGALKESNVDKLSEHEQQRFSFGHDLLKIFGMDRGSRKVHLIVASSLPAPPATGLHN